jgi:hypothetical protein
MFQLLYSSWVFGFADRMGNSTGKKADFGDSEGFSAHFF